MIGDNIGKYHILCRLSPEKIPIVMEYAGFTIKNSIIQSAIPAHSDANMATQQGKTNMIAIVAANQ
jgi:hypothetical protein